MKESLFYFFLLSSTLTCSLLLCTQKSFSQYYNRKHQLHAIGLELGTTGYYGDISNNNSFQIFQTSGLTYGAGINYTFSPYKIKNFRIKTGFNWIHLEGYDKTSSSIPRRSRNLDFQNNLFEFSVMPTYSYRISSKKRRSKRTGTFNLSSSYLYAGIGIIAFTNNPTSKLNGTKYNLRPLALEKINYNLINLGIPLEIGIEINIKKNISLVLNYNLRFTFTDYIDDISGKYVNHTDPIKQKLSNKSSKELIDQLTKESGINLSYASTNLGKNRGSKNRDLYFSINVGIKYAFNKLGGKIRKF